MPKQALYHQMAPHYDALYASKRYDHEVEFLRRMFEAHGESIHTVLDVACGTGNHALRLSQAGYTVTGIDLSREMIAEARKKMPTLSLDVEDMRTFEHFDTFDAIICLFTSINYLTSVEELRHTLSNLAKHLNPGGVLLFDLGEFPEDFSRIDLVDEEEVQIARFANWTYGEDETFVQAKFVFVTKINGKLDILLDTHDLGVFEVGTVQEILEELGFEVLIYSNFDVRLYQEPGDGRPIFVAKKQVNSFMESP